ncbi:MAG: GNAT family N-acetyltransferase, partial [Psychroserpens sp.]|nr:GNAT family N-acetyltransferase [Psychroserpens sp.]
MSKNTMMDIDIRKLHPNESHSYRELRLECLKNFPQNFTSNYEDEKAKDVLFFQPYIEHSNPNNFVVGAFHNNHLIGISGFKRYEADKINHIGIIIQVYVNPEYQAKSVGLNIVK